MSFNTPDAPIDVRDAFPEFADLARGTVRLHPRAGAPGPRDSSLGGPLLWPVGEPWPVCGSADHEDETDEPVALVAVLQLFERDVPELPFPAGADVLQVLWCPGLHDDGYWPLPEVQWRAAADVTGDPAEAPESDADDGVVNEGYLPNPCVLHPERVIEFPDGWALDVDLRDRVMAWSAERGWNYFSHLGAAPGTKAGGWPDWIQDPEIPACDCGTTMTHLVTIASWELDGQSWRRWTPVEELPLDRRPEGTPPAGALAHSDDAGLMLGDAGSMFLFTCERCAHRPVTEVSQCS